MSVFWRRAPYLASQCLSSQARYECRHFGEALSKHNVPAFIQLIAPDLIDVGSVSNHSITFLLLVRGVGGCVCPREGGGPKASMKAGAA